MRDLYIIQNLPAWELTRKEYFRSIATKRFAEGCVFPSYYLKGIPRREFTFQQAWDFAGRDRKIGQAYVISRQILRARKLHPYLRVDHLVEYGDVFKRLLLDHPELQTPEAVSL